MSRDSPIPANLMPKTIGSTPDLSQLEAEITEALKRDSIHEENDTMQDRPAAAMPPATQSPPPPPTTAVPYARPYTPPPYQRSSTGESPFKIQFEVRALDVTGKLTTKADLEHLIKTLTALVPVIEGGE